MIFAIFLASGHSKRFGTDKLTYEVDGVPMTAVELLGTGRHYTREELRKAISGHLCRCTGYENILNALDKAINH